MPLKNKTTNRKKLKKVNEISEKDIQIAKNISINYNICHHCKQTKPIEVLTKCHAYDCPQHEIPSKNIIIDNTTIYKSNLKNI